MMDKIREITVPGLVLQKQDKTDKYGYHWVETNSSQHKHIQQCVLLKEEGEYGYYLPLKPPYEICRRYNVPENHLGVPVVNSGEKEYNALKDFVPDDVFMPTLEYCNYITPSEWFDAFISIVTTFPEMIDNISKFSFMVSSGDMLYDGYFLICYPFVNMCKNSDGSISYKSERCYVVKDTNNIKIDDKYVNHFGNVFFFYKDYMEDWFGGRLLPVIKIKK